MRTTTMTEKTLDVLRSLFARYGLPKELVSDNGPQFVSAAFEKCIQQNGIHHSKSAPYHPANNGAAERVVQTFKHSLRTDVDDLGSLQLKLSRFHLSYRNTPHSTTGKAPSEFYLHRTLRTRLDVLLPSIESQTAIQQLRQKLAHDKRARNRSFTVGQTVIKPFGTSSVSG